MSSGCVKTPGRQTNDPKTGKKRAVERATLRNQTAKMKAEASAHDRYVPSGVFTQPELFAVFNRPQDTLPGSTTAHR